VKTTPSSLTVREELLIGLAMALVTLAACRPGPGNSTRQVASATPTAEQPTAVERSAISTPPIVSAAAPTPAPASTVTTSVVSATTEAPSPGPTAPSAAVATVVASATAPSPSPGPASSTATMPPPVPTVASTTRPAPAAATADAPTVGRYGVFELTLSYPTGSLQNPWEDARATASFTAPSGKSITVDGFYYDTNVYKVRFAPTEIGRYTYSASIQGPTPFAPRDGAFDVVASSLKGFVHASSTKPERLVFADGSLFNALGLQDCFGANPATGDTLGGRNFIDVGSPVDVNTYFATYARAGFNLLRWSIDNCNFPIASRVSTDGNTYLVSQGKLGDQLLQTATSHGFHVMLTFFMQPPYPNAASNPAEQRAVEKYIDYAMARYGAYTDVWELTNESVTSTLPTSWLQFTADYVHQHDPYHRIVTNSLPRDGDSAYLDARSPHWYWNESVHESGPVVADAIKSSRANGEPVIVGEQGNSDCNWDPMSGLRMRIRLWSAFFNDGVFVFWNSSGVKNYCTHGASNIYLGPNEREYTRVLQDFTAKVDPSVATMPLVLSNAGVRGWGLGSSTQIVGYLQHITDQATAVTTNVQVNVPFDGTATWIDPATGKVLATAPVARGQATLTTPSFTTDLALRISR